MLLRTTPPAASDADSVRFPVADQARSRVRREDVATAPPLKTVVLTGSMVSGARKIRSPAPRTDGWMRRRYSSIRPVSTSDRANRAPPWASRYPPERSYSSRVMASARSPAAIVVSPQSADASESENTTLGISFIGLANGVDGDAGRRSTLPNRIRSCPARK